jgi:hypothetical protein
MRFRHTCLFLILKRAEGRKDTFSSAHTSSSFFEDLKNKHTRDRDRDRDRDRKGLSAADVARNSRRIDNDTKSSVLKILQVAHSGVENERQRDATGEYALLSKTFDKDAMSAYHSSLTKDASTRVPSSRGGSPLRRTPTSPSSSRESSPGSKLARVQSQALFTSVQARSATQPLPLGLAQKPNSSRPMPTVQRSSSGSFLLGSGATK